MTTRIHHTLESVFDAIDRHHGAPESLELLLAHDLMDPMGMHLAIITDRILARGWLPAGCHPARGGVSYAARSTD